MMSKKSSKSAAFKVLLPIAVAACLAVSFANCNNSMLVTNNDQINEIASTNQNQPFVIVEDMPEFPGGEQAIFSYISENVVYPEQAKADTIQGTVYLKFVVDKTGKVAQTEIIRGVHPLLDQEAIKVIENMPEWIPGKQSGKPVDVSMSIPIMFQLTD